MNCCCGKLGGVDAFFIVAPLDNTASPASMRLEQQIAEREEKDPTTAGCMSIFCFANKKRSD
jgi:hypothetical protein